MSGRAFEILFHRHESNPILTAADWPYPVHTVFNPGATLLADGKAAPGVEILTGKTGDDLAGRFTITEAKTPGKGDAYAGTLDLTKFKRTDYSDVPSYQMTWTVGTAKVSGVGVVVKHFGADSKRKKYLVVAAGAGNVLVGQHWHPSSSGVQLDFAVTGQTLAGDDNGGRIYLTN